jgi:hypothetical protein
MKRILLFLLVLPFAINSFSQVILDTGDINSGFYLDAGLYNNFGDQYSSPHGFLMIKYGLSRSTALFGYIDYGRYFKDPYDKHGPAVGAGVKLALIKEGELDIPLASSFVLKGDIDIISDMDIYNLYAYAVVSYNLLDEAGLKPYISFGMRYTDVKLYRGQFGNIASDDTEGFITAGTEYRINQKYSVFGEMTFSDEATAGASLRISL